MLKIRIAKEQEYYRVVEFYNTLIDSMQEAMYSPKWTKDVYPTKDYIKTSIASQMLYMGEMEGNVVSCMVVNHEYNESYQQIHWSIEAQRHERYVLHILGVHPSVAGNGIAKQMVQWCIDLARQHSIKTIRLDVLKGNVPAEKVYLSLGFVYLETIEMYYEDTGWTDFKLYEYIV